MSIPLLNTFCRLAATSANKVPRPSRYSITMAVGSKRLSADSDSLLCHVRLWRTSRFRFGCASGCEHSEIKFALHNTHVTPHPPLSRSPFSHWRRLIVTSVSAGIRPTPAPLFFSGRADNACTNLLGYLVRYVRTRDTAEIAERVKTNELRFAPCRTHSPRMARATNSCTREEIYKRGECSLC